MKIVLVTGMLPAGHYSEYVARGLVSHSNIELLVYTDTREENLRIKGCGKILNIWRRDTSYIASIVSRLMKDKPDVVHFQHEMNMFGGVLTAALFPILLLVTRLLGIATVTTVHAAVEKKLISREFLKLFFKSGTAAHKLILWIFFNYVYRSIGKLSEIIIVHTNISKKTLINDYGLLSRKISVHRPAIPERILNPSKDPSRPYFLYFGYIARRKGLENLINGFEKFCDKFPKKNYRLVLAGGVIKGQDRARQEIFSIAERSRVFDRILFTGEIDGITQDRLFNGADAVLIPAILSLGSSGPLYHAFSYGKAILCSRVGHFLEDIKNLENGILVDNACWDEALEFIVRRPDISKKLEAGAMAEALARRPSKVTSGYLELYKGLKS